MTDKATEKGKRRGRPKGETVWRRFSVCIPDEVVRHIEAVAARDGVTRSACIARACRDLVPLTDLAMMTRYDIIRHSLELQSRARHRTHAAGS